MKLEDAQDSILTLLIRTVLGRASEWVSVGNISSGR